MKRHAAALVACIAGALAGCGPRAPEGATMIEAARLYVSPDAPPIEEAAVVFAHGRILEAGPRTQVATRGARRLESCDGGIVAAGFQNSHVHFTGPQFEGAATRPAADLAESLDGMLARYGFTTVVDTASDIANTSALRARIESREIAGPRILTSGFGLYPHDGIPVYLRDLPPSARARLPQPESVAQALGVIALNFGQGADATKLFLMTPQGDAPPKLMDPEIALAAADETHRRGGLVLAHPTDIEGIELAIEAGVDVLVHTTIGDGKTAWEPALIEQMLAHGMSVVPTLQLWPYELARAGVPPHVVELATADAVEQVRAYRAAGGQILFGTDVGYMSVFDPADEYRLLARALSPMQILASLTTAPAARWGETGRRGTIEAAKDADLVVLEQDPAADPAGFARVRCTIRGGRLIHPLPRRM